MTRLLALPLVLLAFHSSVRPLPAPLRAELNGRFWHQGCPVPLSQLRVLAVSYVGFGGRTHTGRLVVNQNAAAPLARVFTRLYELRFPIRHVPSPCTGGTGTGSWSEHAYGEAVDLNPVENPYVGCGRTRDRSSRRYLNRSQHHPGMVTPAVVQAFRSIGWGWGGDWSGSTKDYMHFSATGH